MDQYYIDINIEDIGDPSLIQSFFDSIETKRQLYKYLNHLTHKQHKRIYMKYYLNMSNVEIARIEHVTEGAVRKSIQQSISYLRRKMNKHMF